MLRSLYSRRVHTTVRTSRRSNSRRLMAEELENRQLLAGDCALPWYDVNLNDTVEPLDALAVINDLNRAGGAHPYDAFRDTNKWPDVNFDQWITPIDALMIINDLNRNGGAHPFVLECPSAKPSLTINQLFMDFHGSAVANQKNVKLLRFEAAAEGQDVLMSKIAFEAKTGDVRNAQNYSLWIDLDDNDEAETLVLDGVMPKGDTLIFEGAPQIVRNGESDLYEVRADIASSFVSDLLRLTFAVTDTGYIEAEIPNAEPITGISTNGICEEATDSCSIFVTTQEAVLIHLFEKGNLFVTKSDTPVREQYLLGGTLADTMLGLSFRDQHEPMEVTDLQFTTVIGGQSIDRIELYKARSAVPFATATVGGCGSDPVPADGITFCANMESAQLVVLLGEDVYARPRVKADTAGGIAGEEVAFYVSHVGARGWNSSNTISQNDGDTVAEGEVFLGTHIPGTNVEIVSVTNTVVMSKVTNVADANPDSASSSPGLPSGVYPIAKHRITSASNGNTLNGINSPLADKLTFEIVVMNAIVKLDDFRLYNEKEAATKVAATNVTSIGENRYRVVFSNLAASALDAEIDAGESETFVLEANITNPQVNASESSRIQAFMHIGESGLEWLDHEAIGGKRFMGLDLPDVLIPSTNYRS